MLSYIFTYPISKLNEIEAQQVNLTIILLFSSRLCNTAFQVESLMRNLDKFKPIVKACDIFTVGTHLIATVC